LVYIDYTHCGKGERLERRVEREERRERGEISVE
jgi:hypothetical protein